jgi:hypothetical protein
MDFRTLKIYFNTSLHAEFSIHIDGVPAEIKENYFEFQTPVDLHGSLSVSIKVTEGFVTLEKCTATYPATVNNQLSQITMQQPIKNPVGLISHNEIQTLEFPITITEELSYQHLMFNGPSRFIIKCDEDSRNLYLGNVLDGDLNPYIKSIDTIYNYAPQPNDLFSTSDLEQLYNVVLNKMS